MQIDQRGFRRRQKEMRKVIFGMVRTQLVHIIFKFRKLTRGIAALPVQDMRRQDRFVPVAQMFPHEED